MCHKHTFKLKRQLIELPFLVLVIVVYQILTRFSGASHIASPSLTPNAS
jgi:hypothetical protein